MSRTALRGLLPCRRVHSSIRSSSRLTLFIGKPSNLCSDDATIAPFVIARSLTKTSPNRRSRRRKSALATKIRRVRRKSRPFPPPDQSNLIFQRHLSPSVTGRLTRKHF
jgi:hypothetical protein